MSQRAFRGALSTMAFVALTAMPHLALAQRRYNDDSDGILTCFGGLIIIPIAFIVLNIAMLVWVARDAKNRGMETPVIWMLLVLFTSFIGLIIYLLSRPKGSLRPCPNPNCGNRKLPMLSRCPHCGVTV